MDKKLATKLKINDDKILRADLLMTIEQLSRQEAVLFASKAVCDFAIEKAYYSPIIIEEIKNTINSYQQRNVKISSMRSLALKLHDLARQSPHPLTRAYYRAWGHVLAAAHVPTHAIVATDYLVYIVNLNAPQNIDAVKAIRQHQLSIAKKFSSPKIND
ncbi:MAG: hypothetical protein PHP09_04165 [Bacilli bacterium]|jgi:hypothetical protein|nr:hypothetical protein [Bacilli bacterium]MDD4345113.1 hypothetical protein [Bacilli bacterium]MDD4521048.1 hypothetical protein [Bacilli bacterium]